MARFENRTSQPTIVWLLLGLVLLFSLASVAIRQTAVASACPPVRYTVVAGETLSQIAEEHLPPGYGTSDFTHKLQGYNNLATYEVHTGQQLRIPNQC